MWYIGIHQSIQNFSKTAPAHKRCTFGTERELQLTAALNITDFRTNPSGYFTALRAEQVPCVDSSSSEGRFLKKTNFRLEKRGWESLARNQGPLYTKQPRKGAFARATDEASNQCSRRASSSTKKKQHRKAYAFLGLANCHVPCREPLAGPPAEPHPKPGLVAVCLYRLHTLIDTLPPPAPEPEPISLAPPRRPRSVSFFIKLSGFASLFVIVFVSCGAY